MHPGTASALLVLLAVLGLDCASVSRPSIEDLVWIADSPDDHMRMAEYYRAAAAEAREDAAQHQRLAEVYGGRHRWGMAFAARAREHCNELSASAEKSAAQYEWFAAEHERLAEE